MFKIGVKNFRVLDNVNNLNLKHVNILTGTNNSGKSTIVKLLLLLQDAFSHSHFPELFFVTAKYNLGNFRTNITRGNNEKFITIVFAPEDKTNFEYDFYFQYRFIENIENEERAVFYDFQLFIFNEEAPFVKIICEKFEDIEMIDKLKEDNNFPVDAPTSYSMYINQNQIFKLFYNIDNLEEGYKKTCQIFSEKRKNLENEMRILENIEKDLEAKEQKEEDKDILNEIDENIKNIKTELELKNLELKNLLEILQQLKLGVGLYVYYPIVKTDNLSNNIDVFLMKYDFEYHFSSGQLLIFKNYVAYNDEVTKDGVTKYFRTLFSNVKNILQPFTKHQFYHVSSVLDLNSRIIIDNPANIFLRDFKVYKDNEKISKEINKWLKIFDICDNLEIERLKNSGFALRPKNNSKSINIADWGDGTKHLVSLILQIIVLANIRDDKAKIFLIEEPEVHLHPKMQSMLAEFFIEIAENLNIKLIIETHSEYLIRKIQILVAERKAKSENISIFYFDNGMKPIIINDDGNLSVDFGEGFFDESATLITGLWQIQRK